MIISKLRKKLHDSIQKYGLMSNETYKISVELDEEIVKYYQSSVMLNYYKNSLEGLKRYKEINNKVPNKREWNEYAYKNNYLSSESMKYIGNIKFEKKANLS